MADIQEINIELTRQFTGATIVKDAEGKPVEPLSFTYYDDGSGKEDFRFFRYSQDYPSDLDYGNEEGKAGGTKHTRISGDQLQTLAKCLIDFFGYNLNDVKYEASLNNLKSIKNPLYKNGSAISTTIGEIQNGRGLPKIADVSKYLKLQIIRRYSTGSTKNETDEKLLNSAVTLESTVPEQVGVIGPVTYNFIIRQAIYQWFNNVYLNNADSFLNKTLQKLNSNLWSTIEIDGNLKYTIFVSNTGQPKNKPYPTIGVLFDIDGDVNVPNTIEKARTIIDSLLSRDTSSLIKDGIYGLEKKIKTRDEEPTRVCVYADLAEVLYCPIKKPDLTLIDMIKAGISYLHQHAAEFEKTNDVSSTPQSIQKSIAVPSAKFDGLDDKIDQETFMFRKPDMQDMLIKDAVLFDLTDDADPVYTNPYGLVLQDLFSTHFKYTTELIQRLESERKLRKNILIRNYPSAPFDENVKFYYDKNYNLLAAAFRKNNKKPEVAVVPEDQTVCITQQNNPNLTIPNIEEQKSILDYLSGKTYTKLNDQTVLFITEFFIREYAIKSDIYTENKDLYDKIKTDIKADINANANKIIIPESVKTKADNIPPKEDLFLESDYTKVKVDYLYSYNENFLLDEDTEAPSSALQLVKLKSSNFWTNVFQQIPDEQASLDGFLRKHYPYLTHDTKPPPPPPPATKKEDEPKPVSFERLKTKKLSIPNEIDLSTKLKIDDLLSGDCFAALTGLINNKFPAFSSQSQQFDSIFTIMNSLDWCYLINLAINGKLSELIDLQNKLGTDSNSQEVAQSISSTIDIIRDCIPPKPPEYVGDISTPEDTFRVACEIALLNIPKIPYLVTPDFLQILKRLLFEFITQLILELIIQFLNQIIEQIKKELCSPRDKTANALVKAPAPKKLPIFPSPDDVSGLSGCSIVELLSVNPNISKNQIYSVIRSFFNVENISNSEFEVYFTGLSSILQTQETINLFSNNIDDKLYSLIKNYSDKKDFSKFSKLVFNLSTTSNFFKFLSKYVDLTPCYEQLAQDTVDPNYCFDPPREQGDYSSEEILARANDLIGQITDLCASLSSNQSAIFDKLKSPVLLDEEAKNAISSGMQNIIATAYNNFLLLKQNSINSFETIKVFNDMVSLFNMSKIQKVFETKKSFPNYFDAFTDVLFTAEQPSLVAKSYETLKVSHKSNIQVQIGTAITYYSDVTAKKSDQIFYDQKNLTSQSEGEIIIPKTGDKIKEIKTFINTGGAFTIAKYNVEDFSKIFFDDYRFKVYKNIVTKEDREKAIKQKNYYYVYDNLLNNSKNTNIIEDLKKYKQVKEELEKFIKDPPPPPEIPKETPQGIQ